MSIVSQGTFYLISLCNSVNQSSGHVNDGFQIVLIGSRAQCMWGAVRFALEQGQIAPRKMDFSLACVMPTDQAEMTGNSTRKLGTKQDFPRSR